MHAAVAWADTAAAMFLPPCPEIATERLTIRLVREADLPDLRVVNGSEAVTRYLPYDRWTSDQDALAWFQRMQASMDRGDTAQFVLVQRSTGRVIGSCLLFRHEPISARAELGYVLGEAHWGGGWMREALQAVLPYAFEQGRLRRLEAVIDPRNTASARVLEGLGFQVEGLQRERWALKGELSDSRLYGLLRREWEARRSQATPGF